MTTYQKNYSAYAVSSLGSANTICIRHGDEYSVQFARLFLSDKFTVFKVNGQCAIHCTCMNSRYNGNKK